MSSQFLDHVRLRRSAYSITKSSPVPDSKIIEIVNESTKHCPSSLNILPNRAVLLLGAEHDKFWQMADEVQREKLTAEEYTSTLSRRKGFAGGYGTVGFHYNF